MVIRNYIEKDQYYDSVFLMRIANEIGKQEGIEKISVGMGTPLNKDTLSEMGLLLPAGEQAGPNDLIFAISADSDEFAQKVKEAFFEIITSKKTKKTNSYKTIDNLCQNVKDINLAVITVAGEFAYEQAKAALENKMNVFMFSDNVSIEQEIKLKNMASKKDLLMMGPNCGLCFINGIALGLCSKTRRGNIGIVAASGSGMQEVMAIIHKNGLGISHAIGTGGRDLSEQIGGATMIQGIRLLEKNDMTEVIVLISKPPAVKTLKLILDEVNKCTKPVIIQFINDNSGLIEGSLAISSKSFGDTAAIAVALAKKEQYKLSTEQEKFDKVKSVALEQAKSMAPEQKYFRGLYCGGTLMEESMTVMTNYVGDIFSNAPFEKKLMLESPFESRENSLIDMGEEDFTKGRPHVAIDPLVRLERFKKEARDSETAVILLDFLLGYSMHEDPAGIMAEVISKEKKLSAQDGRHLCVVASICGTDYDPQGYDNQKEKLEKAGVIVMENNGMAARMAAAVINGLRGELKIELK